MFYFNLILTKLKLNFYFTKITRLTVFKQFIFKNNINAPITLIKNNITKAQTLWFCEKIEYLSLLYQKIVDNSLFFI